MVTGTPDPSFLASRRHFLAATCATALYTGLSNSGLAEQTAVAPGKFRRVNLTDAKAAKNLKSYEKAITAMVKLPPSDPRNWYRIAVIHLLDCPHGNWWFLPWHRGFLGWFELICRELSGDAEFALPYWDWTADPRLPKAFLEGNLNPANFPIKGLADFENSFKEPLDKAWKAFNKDQLAQLELRGLNSIETLWKQIEGKFDPNDTAPMFPELADVRNLNPPHTQEFDDRTNKAASLGTILDALGPRDFVGFGSGRQPNHHEPLAGGAVFGVLEGQPHNAVHNLVGGYVQGNPSRQGFMSAFLSPVDPIFFMHHANIDRLWDVWTRKQQAFDPHNPAATIQYPTTPTGADLTTWNSEPFLFFVDSKGQPTAKKQSGDFVSVDAFNYDYQPGSGEVVIPATPRPANLLANKSFAARLNAVSAFQRTSQAAVDDTDALSKAAGAENGVRVVAKITAQLPPETRTMRLYVLVNPPAGTQSVSFTDPSYAGSFELFGGHSHGKPAHGMPTVTFTIGLTDAIKRLREMNRIQANMPLDVRVVAESAGISLVPYEIKVTEISLSSF